MTFQVMILPLLAIVAALVLAVIYVRTKSLSKTGSVAQALLAICAIAVAVSIDIGAENMVVAVMLGLGLLISGILDFR